MNAINLELDILHYLDSNGDVIVEVYNKGSEEPLMSSSVPIFNLIKDFVDVLSDHEEKISDSDCAEAAYELVDEFQDCIDFLNDHIEDPEE
jgi:hypothetical protein